MRYIALVLTFYVLSCDNRAKQNSDETEEKKVNKIELENFDEFLTRFNTDRVFKLTRIRFPIEQAIKDPIEGNHGYMIYDSTDNWLKTLSLEYKKEFHDSAELDYKQDTIWTDYEITVQQRGGYLDSYMTWDMDFVFTLQEGKWYLTRMKDFSYQ